jgi:polysaccharide chain length determinant protein (PEP-CTERM system associated)
MLPGRKFSAEDALHSVLRLRWLLLFPAVFGLVAGVGASSQIPKKYRSETLILVVPPRIPQEIVPRNPETVAERLNTINDVIMSRSRLERIIQDLNLYDEQRGNKIMEDLVQRMRKDITVKIEGKESFRVSYVSDAAKTAQMATDRLASLYIEENLHDQSTLAQSTNQFLESQLEEARQRLGEQEKKLEQYKNLHAGQLPSQQPGNLQAIQNAQMQLQSTSEAMNRARERRILIERQLADAETLPVAPRPVDGGSGGVSDAPKLTTAQQLEAEQARLVVYRQKYTPEHPDIKTLEHSIADLEKKLADENAVASNNPQPKALTPAEASRQRQVNELKAQMEAIDLQLSSGLAEQGRLKGVIADYQGKVNAVPARESELVELTRDYNTLSESYLSLLKKREDSKLNENLVRRQIGEQFKILDAASLPQKPYNAVQRLLIVAAGPIAGLVFGLVLVGLGEYRNSSFRTEDDVARLLSLPVLALVPTLISERDRARQRRRVMLLDIGGSAFTVIAIAALVLWRLQS